MIFSLQISKWVFQACQKITYYNIIIYTKMMNKKNIGDYQGLYDVIEHSYYSDVYFGDILENQHFIKNHSVKSPHQINSESQDKDYLWNSLAKFQRNLQKRSEYKNSQVLWQNDENDELKSFGQYIMQKNNKNQQKKKEQNQSIPSFFYQKQQQKLKTNPIVQPSKSLKPKAKNQYDKNIIGNILRILIQDVFQTQYQEELLCYCDNFNVKTADFYSSMHMLKMRKSRLGTTQLHNFLQSSTIEEGVKKVFSKFTIRYLNNDYLHYISKNGKMKDIQKYIKYSVKLMYVAKLSIEELQNNRI